MIKVICLIGPSASGKDTLLQKVLNKSSLVVPIVRYTTRPMREGEINGKDYFFLTTDEFTEKVLNCQMAEAAEFNNWFYGTGKDVLDKDKINIMTCDLVAADNLYHDPDLDVCIIHVEVEPKERLIRALKREKNPDVNEVVRRFIDDERKYDESNFVGLPYYTVKNNSKTQLKNAVGEICNLIGGFANVKRD